VIFPNVSHQTYKQQFYSKCDYVVFAFFPSVCSARELDTFYLYLEFFTLSCFYLRFTICHLKEKRKSERTECVWDVEDGGVEGADKNIDI
jgi:hypothetical protein